MLLNNRQGESSGRITDTKTFFHIIIINLTSIGEKRGEGWFVWGND